MKFPGPTRPPEFEKKWHRYARLIGPSWRVDETYVKVGGTWTYLYRGVDKSGKSTVSHLSRNRTVGAAKTYVDGGLKRRNSGGER